MSPSLPRAAVLAAAAWLCLGTQPARHPRAFPRWRVVSEAKRTAFCAELEATIAKSGKEGLGLTVAMRPVAAAGDACDVTIGTAHLDLPRQPPSYAGPIAAPRTQDATRYYYLPFAFDNDAAWNAGLVDATLTLELTASGAEPVTWTLSLHQDYEGPHTTREWHAQ